MDTAGLLKASENYARCRLVESRRVKLTDTVQIVFVLTKESPLFMPLLAGYRGTGHMAVYQKRAILEAISLNREVDDVSLVVTKESPSTYSSKGLFV